MMEPKESNPLGRTLTPNSQQIQKFRLGYGWSVETLAAKARCSDKTIKNLEAGQNAFLTTFKKVAAAFNVEVWAVCHWPEVWGAPPANAFNGGMPTRNETQFPASDKMQIPTSDKMRIVTMQLKTSFEHFDECKHLADLMQSLMHLLRPGHRFEVLLVNEGSVDIVLALHEDDVRRLLATIADGSLKELHGDIESVTFQGGEVPEVNHDGPIAIVIADPLSQQSGPLSWEVLLRNPGSAQLAAFFSCLREALQGSRASRLQLFRALVRPAFQHFIHKWSGLDSGESPTEKSMALAAELFHLIEARFEKHFDQRKSEFWLVTRPRDLWDHLRDFAGYQSKIFRAGIKWPKPAYEYSVDPDSDEPFETPMLLNILTKDEENILQLSESGKSETEIATLLEEPADYIGRQMRSIRRTILGDQGE